MKNKVSFRTTSMISTFFVRGIFLAVLAFPAFVFGQGVVVQSGVINFADTGTTDAVASGSTGIADYRWFEYGVQNPLSSYHNNTPSSSTAYANATPRKFYDNSYGYAERITGLTPGTKYVFRSVAELNGVRYYGLDMTFQTRSNTVSTDTNNYTYTTNNTGTAYNYNNYNQNVNSNNGTSYYGTNNGTNNQNTTSGTGNGNYTNNGYYYNSYYPSSVITKQADFLSYTSARLNANLFPSSQYNVYGWYEWGTTTDLGSATSRVFIGKGPSLYFGQILSGLTPGTNYFFKPVIENSNGTKVEGTMLVFKTAGVSPFTNTEPDSSYSTTHTNTISPSKIANETTYGSTGTAKMPTVDPEKTIKIKDSQAETPVVPGGKTKNKVVFENTTGSELSHSLVRVILPEGETFVSTENDNCKKITDQVLFCDIGNMAVGQKTEISYEVETSKDLAVGTPLEVVTIASGEYKDGRRVENFQRSQSSVVAGNENGDNLAAAALFGGSSFSIKDLLLFLEFVLFFFLAYFVWRLFSEKSKKEEKNTLEALQYLRHQEVVLHKKQDEVNVSLPVTEKGIPPENLPI